MAIPVLVLSLISYVRKYEAYTREIQRLTSDLSTRIEESVRGIRVVKALGRSPEQITEYTRDAEHLNEVEHRRAMLVARVGILSARDCGGGDDARPTGGRAAGGIG